MSLRINLGALVVGLLWLAWSEPCLAQSKGRFHLGLDASIVNSTVVSAKVPDPDAYSSSSEKIKLESSNTSFGLPGATAFSLGVLINDHVDLGARFSYVASSNEFGSSVTKTKTDSSLISFNPYIAYLFGSYTDRTRFIIGATAGLGSGSATTKVTTASSSTDASPVESSTSATQFGAFLGLRGFVSDSVSLDPSVYLMKSNQTFDEGDSDDLELSGVSFMANFGISVWFGGKAQVPVAAAPTKAAEPSPTDDSDMARAIAEQPGLTSDRITLALGEGRAVTVIVTSTQADRPAQLIFRETSAVSALSTCESVSMHSVSKTDDLIPVVPGKMSSNSGEVAIVKGDIPFEKLMNLVTAPLVSAAMPDHWFDVCGSRWFVYEMERGKLAKFLKARRAVLPSIVTPVEAEVAPKAVEETPATTETPTPTEAPAATEERPAKVPAPTKTPARAKTPAPAKTTEQ